MMHATAFGKYAAPFGQGQKQTEVPLHLVDFFGKVNHNGERACLYWNNHNLPGVPLNVSFQTKVNMHTRK